MKISVVGAGNVGATLAMRLVENDLGDVVLMDILEGMPQGKALDISDALSITGNEGKIVGTNDYDDLKSSNIVVITAGLARTPGMSRGDLIYKNAAIVKGVIDHIKIICPNAIVIVVTNPLDAMAYYAYKLSGFEKSRIIGMAGTLDSARLVNLISLECGIPRSKIKTYVLGCHGDTMVPLISKTMIDGKPLEKVLTRDKIDKIVNHTRNRGAEIVGLLKTGSAYYSPSAGVLEIVKAISSDNDTVLSVSAFLDGEYDLKDLFLGVPVKINKNGVKNVERIDLSESEKKAFYDSADKTRKLISELPKI